MSKSRVTSKNIGWAVLAVMAVSVLVLRDTALQGVEFYDHILDPLSFRLDSAMPWIPDEAAHDSVMALGFLLLGSAAVSIPALLGARRSWIVVGLIILGLNLSWWLVKPWNPTVAAEVGAEFQQQIVSGLPPVLGYYLVYSAAGVLGALAGEKAIFRIFGKSGGARKKSKKKSGSKH